MLRSNLSAILSRNRWTRLSECALSTVKVKQVKSTMKAGGRIRKRSLAQDEIIKLTEKKNSVVKGDVDLFLKAHPLSSLSADEVSSLVWSLGRKKYTFESAQLTQLVAALDSVELHWNAKCLGKIKLLSCNVPN